MYKFYQEGSSENEKNEDPEGVKKEQDAYNATKTLLPGLFSEIKNVLYTPKQDYSLGVDNKINKLNVDNKNEKVSFVKENRVVPNLMNAKSEDVGTFVNMRPYAKDNSMGTLASGFESIKRNAEQLKNTNKEYLKKGVSHVQNKIKGATNFFENTRNSYYSNTELRSALFALKSPRHMAAALAIGPGIYKNHLNLASTAERIARSGEVLDGVNERDRREQGNEHGAVRHTLWQAALASWFSNDVAKDAGDAHETRPYIDTNQRLFEDLNEADMVVDLLNNKIGRGIGNRNRFTGLKKLALNILEEFKNKGLYVASDINGRYIITRRQLEQEKYDELRELFNNMDNWGFQPGDDRTRDNYAPIRFIWEKIKEKMQ